MNRQIVDELTKAFVDRGKIIEAGWKGLETMAIPPSAGDTQRKEMRKAFFAGAQHLYASMMSMLDSDTEPTQTDLDRMTLIHNELEEFVKELKEESFT